MLSDGVFHGNGAQKAAIHLERGTCALDRYPVGRSIFSQGSVNQRMPLNFVIIKYMILLITIHVPHNKR